MTHLPPLAWRLAAACSLLSAITTLLLIYLPQFYAPIAEGLPGRMARVSDPVYQLRAWVYLVHPLLVLPAALAMGAALRPRAPLLARLGAASFVVWGLTELAQQCLTLQAFDRWRVGWLAGDLELSNAMPVLLRLYDGIWDAMYFLLLLAFLAANVLFGVAVLRQSRGNEMGQPDALRRPDRLGQVVGALYLAAAALTLSLLVVEVGGPTLPAPLAAWSYPLIQPLARVLIGVWLWKYAMRLPGTSADSPAQRSGHSPIRGAT